MTIDDSLEHPWIKVSVSFSIHFCGCSAAFTVRCPADELKIVFTECWLCQTESED